LEKEGGGGEKDKGSCTKNTILSTNMGKGTGGEKKCLSYLLLRKKKRKSFTKKKTGEHTEKGKSQKRKET